MAKSGLFYVRFMDDILVLAPPRWWFRNPKTGIVSVPYIQLPQVNRKKPGANRLGRLIATIDDLVFRILGAFNYRPVF